MTDG
jgi:hypothetical protein